MPSLDVYSLFTNILIDETMDFCSDSLCKDHDKSPKIPKNDFCKLNLATKESFFMLSKKFYKQIDSVVMGPPLSLAQANNFICRFENKWLKDCPLGLKPVFCSQCVGVLFD